jgi:hypothetical protein
MPARPEVRASLSEDKRAYQDKKVVLLARDVRDVLVWFDGTLAEFVRSSVFGARKVATFYEIWSRNRIVPREFLLIRYEQLHAAPEDALTSVLRFIGAPELERSHLAAAVAYARRCGGPGEFQGATRLGWRLRRLPLPSGCRVHRARVAAARFPVCLAG